LEGLCRVRLKSLPGPEYGDRLPAGVTSSDRFGSILVIKGR